MLTRRQFLERSLQSSSLVAAGGIVPSMVARTALATEPERDNVLVILELTGGNDGLNTVIPYADDLYRRARPTLAYRACDVLRVDDSIGLHPSLSGLASLLDGGQLAVVQGVGYPNRNRSHSESMRIWQSADPEGKRRNGWLGRSIDDLKVRPGQIAAFHLADQARPLALEGLSAAVATIDADQALLPNLAGTSEGFEHARRTWGLGDVDLDQFADHRDLIRNLSNDLGGSDESGLRQFVQRTGVETYNVVDRLEEQLRDGFTLPEGGYALKHGQYRLARQGLHFQLSLVARMIQAGFAARVYYVSLDGFDTHCDQRDVHARLLAQVGSAIGSLFEQLENSGDAGRVVLMTCSEFGRRVKENGSKGTDHGAASSLFIAGPAVKGCLVGDQPSLSDDALVDGDLKVHTDFRQVYATLLDRWLGCDSHQVLGARFEHLPLF